MKRNRGELTTMAAKPSTETTTKSQRRRNEAQSRAPAMTKASQDSEELNSCGVAVKTESPVLCAELGDFVCSEATEFGGFGWFWNGGVMEDKLLGWLPFVDEDFLFPGSENRGCEEDDSFHDIWQLLHINEVPSTAK